MVCIGDGLARHDEDNRASFAKLLVQRAQLRQWVERMLERVVGNDDAGIVVRNFVGTRKTLYAIRNSVLPRIRVDFDANPLPAADVLEEEAATAAEIQHVVGLRDVGRELGPVRPASE